jgi:hypothetical protein
MGLEMLWRGRQIPRPGRELQGRAGGGVAGGAGLLPQPRQGGAALHWQMDWQPPLWRGKNKVQILYSK